MAAGSVTEDLLARSYSGPPGLATAFPQALVVTYVRATDLAEGDPREAVLRPTRRWLLKPGMSLGMGRSPGSVDVAVPLLEDGGQPNPAVPRVAARLEHHDGTWWITNHATGSSTITVSSPGAAETLSSASPPHAVLKRRVTVTVESTGATGPDDDGPAQPVEHRLTLIAPGIPEDMPLLVPGLGSVSGAVPGAVPGVGPGGAPFDADDVGTLTQPTSDYRPTWSAAQCRLLAAWAYTDLLGLRGPGVRRNRQARLLLRQSMTTPKDPNERVLKTLRDHAERELRRSFEGETNTPAFVSYLVERRAWLGPALVQLHEEYDRLHPSGSPSGSPSGGPSGRAR